MDKDCLLKKYKKIWDKIDVISKQTDIILKTSAVGQAPPIFHSLTDKQMVIINKKALPIWESLKHFIKEDFKTYWQYTRWRKGTLPPHFNELGE